MCAWLIVPIRSTICLIIMMISRGRIEHHGTLMRAVLNGFVLGSCCTCTPVLLRLSPNKASSRRSVSISHRIICEIQSQSSQIQKAPISVRLMCLNALLLCSYSRTEAITRWLEGHVIREWDAPSSHHAIEAYLDIILPCCPELPGTRATTK